MNRYIGRFFIFLLVLNFVFLPAFSADWPVDLSVPKNSSGANKKNASIKLNFGENREGFFVPGFVFTSNECDVTSFGDGKVIFKSDAANVYYEDFSSALGSSVIVAHPDKMISVYANLSEINSEVVDKKDVSSGQVIGKVNPSYTGLGGFHLKNETLEFQVIDTQSRVSINSYLILPKVEGRYMVYPGVVHLENRKGTLYNLDERKIIPNGVYSVYRDFVNGRMPLSTEIFVNGKSVSFVSFDMLASKNGSLFASGKDGFSFSRIFSLPKKQYMGDIHLVRGKNEISLFVTDFDKNERKITYVIDVY